MTLLFIRSSTRMAAVPEPFTAAFLSSSSLLPETDPAHVEHYGPAQMLAARANDPFSVVQLTGAFAQTLSEQGYAHHSA